jgi:hypothetical protein
MVSEGSRARVVAWRDPIYQDVQTCLPSLIAAEEECNGRIKRRYVIILGNNKRPSSRIKERKPKEGKNTRRREGRRRLSKTSDRVDDGSEWGKEI